MPLDHSFTNKLICSLPSLGLQCGIVNCRPHVSLQQALFHSANYPRNGRYKESFGLSDSFACQHKRVGSVFMMVEQHPSILVVRKVKRIFESLASAVDALSLLSPPLHFTG